jgi:Fur family peroxide stress response transcriptional regulator
MQDKIENITEYLIQNNIRPSFHRIKILDYIMKNNNHPTVDEIFKAVVKEVPTLSKTTVYTTLTLFIKAKILNALYIEEKEIRYDPILFNHGHFECKQCGEIYDFATNIDEFNSEGLGKFQIHEKGVYFKGICPKCIDNKRQEEY